MNVNILVALTKVLETVVLLLIFLRDTWQDMLCGPYCRQFLHGYGPNVSPRQETVEVKLERLPSCHILQFHLFNKKHKI